MCVCIIMCLFSVASVSASDVNDTVNADPSDNILYDVVIADGGVVVGVCTKSPLIGAAAGAATGVILGAVASIITNRYTYDMHYNPLKNTIFIIGVSVAAGIVGGVISGYMAYAYERSLDPWAVSDQSTELLY